MADLEKLPDDADAVITKLYNDIHAHEMTGNGGMKRVTTMREAVKLIEAIPDLAAALIEADKALAKIASCTSHHPDDVVGVARAARDRTRKITGGE